MEEDASFRAYYLRNTSQIVALEFLVGLSLQVGLSFLLSPFGSRSKLVNCIYLGTTVISLRNVHSASTNEQLTANVGIPTAALFCLTRLLRMWTLARSPASESIAWLNVGRSDWGGGMKGLSALLLGNLLTMISAGLAPARRVSLILVPELLRVALFCVAAAKADASRTHRQRVWQSAARQIVAGVFPYTAGIALSWLHEVTLWRMWRRMQSLEACASSQSLVDQQCLLSLFADAGLV
jgi:hypothetical protein